METLNARVGHLTGRTLNLFTMALLLAVTNLTASAWASGEVQVQLDQMKTNVENSQKNQESYEKNAKIADENLKAIEENLKGLNSQRTQIRDNAQRADQNIATMTKQETQLKELMNKESVNIEAEKKQVEQLQAKINQLNENLRKRQGNMSEYQGKMERINKEKVEWAEQKKMAQDLEKIINEKEKLANSDRAEWKKKSSAYDGEVKKWKSEADENRLTMRKYEKLNK